MIRRGSSTDCLTFYVENNGAALCATVAVSCVNCELHPPLDCASRQHWVQDQEMHTNDIDSSLEAKSYQPVANEMV